MSGITYHTLRAKTSFFNYCAPLELRYLKSVNIINVEQVRSWTLWVNYLLLYVYMSDHQTAEQNHSIKVACNSFENVTIFKYMEMIVTRQNCFHKEFKNIMVNAHYCAVLNLLSSHLISKSVKIKVYKTIILVLFCICKIGLSR
jgi:hypothetical protein